MVTTSPAGSPVLAAPQSHHSGSRPSSAKLPESTGSPSPAFNANRVKRGHFTSGTKRRPVSFTVPGTYQALQHEVPSCHLLPIPHTRRQHTEVCVSHPVSFWENGPRKALFSSRLLTCQKLWPAGVWQRPGEAGQHLPFRAVERWPPKSQVPSSAAPLRGLVLFGSHVCLPRPQVSSATPNVSHECGDLVTRTSLGVHGSSHKVL